MHDEGLLRDDVAVELERFADERGVGKRRRSYAEGVDFVEPWNGGKRAALMMPGEPVFARYRGRVAGAPVHDPGDLHAGRPAQRGDVPVQRDPAEADRRYAQRTRWLLQRRRP